MDIALALSGFAILVATIGAAVEVYSIRHIDRRLAAESDKITERGSIGEQFGQWLLTSQKAEDGEEVTNFVVLARGVGHEIARSFSMAAKGIASGESRTIRSVEKAVLEGLQTPETSALLGFCDQIGVDRELAGTVLQVLEARGLLPKVLGKHEQGNGGASWG